MRSNLLIYGVTGYLGSLISRLAAAAGLPHLAAGRDLEQVIAHADPLMLPARTFSLSDPAKVGRALGDVAVVLNAAGPFAETALPLAEACLRAGAHYLDLADEVPELEAIRRLDARAREAGIMLLPGVGFGVLPTDALAARLKRRLPSAVRLRLALETVGGMSRGSLRTLFRGLRRGAGVKRRGGELVPARAGEERLVLDLGGGRRVAVTDPWRGDLASAWWSSVYPEIDVYAVHPAWLRSLRSLRSLPWPGSPPSAPWLPRWASASPVRALLASRAGRTLVRRAIALRPAGPAEAELGAGLTRIWAQAEDAAGHRVTARLRGPERHLFTARTTLWVAQRVLAGRLRVGCQTPATAYGPDLVDRLVEEVEGVSVTWG
ncbi:MAG TPA: saccharopine dehydrogenase NADP-binding domain-containing protein [Thermoanaerobaculia bacterium]|nr:saccharopine dehydrogenase NADP-binding domain-containing protein [Thermoanaerobaculia bacterium]